MRNLNMTDVFKTARMIEQAGVMDELQNVKKRIQEKSIKSVEAAGFEIISSLLLRCSGTEFEKQFYELIAGILEQEPEEVAGMDPFKLMMKIKEISEGISKEDAEAFFAWLSKLTK